MKLVIAEKPSVAKSVADVLGATKRGDGYLQGGGYIVSWCVGHLVGLAQADAYDEKYGKWRYEDLPIIPGEWKHNAAPGKKQQLDTLRRLMADNQVDVVINACDAGREGELIFRLVYEYCGCSKTIKRLWISSMEESAIAEGFQNLKDSTDYDRLYQSALCRSKADWLVGINATRLFSVLYHETLNVGRVQTPTLALVVQRENEIAAFTKEPFYTPEIDLGEFAASGEKMKDKETAENTRAACDGKTATVQTVERQEKTAAPPKLYDLTTLQREANRQHGFTAQQTLDYVQSLYEKKLATYPRTDSRYLTSDMAKSVPVIVNQSALILPGVRGNAAIVCNTEQVMNNAKVSDHHAIIPTMAIRDADLNSLPAGEKAVLFMLAARLVCAVGDKHIYAETSVTLDCESCSFMAKGKTVLQNGWKAVEQAFKSADQGVEKDNDGEKGKSLPEQAQGQTFENVHASVKEGFTSPPKHYTEDLLLAAMETAGAEDMPEDAERKGLGPPATRAGIIEKLVKSGFIERKAAKKVKHLYPTQKGVNLITVLPDVVKSPLLTAEWESQLKQVERGEISDAGFLDGIVALTSGLVSSYNTPDPKYKGLFSKAPGGEVVGTCPRCGKSVVESKKGFFCESRTCGFALWRDNRFFTIKKKEITKKVAAALLKEGRVSMSGLYSEKTGKTYNAAIIMEDTGGKYVNFKLEFEKKGGK